MSRVEAIAAGIEAVRTLKDPIGVIIESWTRPNGLLIERVRADAMLAQQVEPAEIGQIDEERRARNEPA